MAQQVKIWYDPEGDFLEVLFSDKAGYMQETNNDAVMERVDDEGNILGFYSNASQPSVQAETSYRGFSTGKQVIEYSHLLPR